MLAGNRDAGSGDRRRRLDAATSLVCDADQHSPRGTELFGATLALLPHLEVNEDMRLIGTVTAHTGAVGALLVAAAAAQRARATEQPCLALSVGDPFMRMALIARPPPAPAQTPTPTPTPSSAPAP
jgi:hypothetical protein